jgi:molybdopterin molybdotransferase
MPRDLGIARDDVADVRERVTGALDADVLVTTAGASVGDHDVVKDALEELGLDVAFWRVTMRPGSPVSFGSLPRAGSGALPVFGLPGNPVSALVTFEVLVRPALRRMQGRSDVHSATVRVRAGERMRSTASLTHYLRVRLVPGADGVPVARLTGGQGSGMLSSVARADALLIVPLGRAVLEQGEEATALLLPALDEGQAGIGYDPGARAAED